MLAIIGGTRLTQLPIWKITHRQVMRTPYGEPSGAITFGRCNQHEVMFLARHGYGHTIPPHRGELSRQPVGAARTGRQRVVSVATGGRHPRRPDARRDRGAGPDHRLHPWARMLPILTEATAGDAHAISPMPYSARIAQPISCAARKRPMSLPGWRRVCRHAGAASGNGSGDQPLWSATARTWWA